MFPSMFLSVGNFDVSPNHIVTKCLGCTDPEKKIQET